MPRGGKRAGAGRPSSGRHNEVLLRLSDEAAAFLRGQKNQSEYIETLLRTEKQAMIPNDVQQYLTQAAEALAKEQGFKPANKQEMKIWLLENMSAIAQKASDLQCQLLNKVAKSPEVGKVMAATVWGEINRRAVTAKENQALDRIINAEQKD